MGRPEACPRAHLARSVEQMTSSWRIVIPLLVLATLAMWGCAEDGSCMLDPPTDVEVDPTLASIQGNIFTPICSGCHFPGGTGPMPLDTEEASYASLVEFPLSFSCSTRRVVTGEPDNSCLVFKIEWLDNYSGQGMPPTAQLSDDKIDAIRQWISDGALP